MSGESPRNRELIDLRFRILAKIHDFTDAKGNVYHLGDSVELPEEQYLGLPWLEPIENKPKNNPNG